MATKPIGPGTVNRTVNLPREVDRQLGRAVVQLGERSRGEILRKALADYLRRTGMVGLLVMFWGGAALMSASSVVGAVDKARRCVSRDARVVRPWGVRRNNEEGYFV